MSDTGIGIPAHRVGALFQPFSQIDSSTTRHYGGTGLGLSIVRRLVELMHGETGVVSNEGSGSMFWFTARFGRSGAKRETQFLDADVLKNRRALIVDDNATNRKVLRLQLAQFGIQTHSVDSAEAAIAELGVAAGAQQPFDLAILDYMMPGCDGLGLASQIVSDGRYRAMRLVLLTSAQAIRGESDMASLGFSAYLLKPVSNRELRECLIRVLSSESARWHIKTQPVAQAAALTEQLTSRRVLLAEDNPVNQKVACGALQKIGLTVDVAGNGVEAVAAWEARTYDLILMDCQMPVMDGYQASREIRAREAGTRRIPIIALTADAMKGTEQQCREAGMDDYLTKPIDRARLSEVIQRYLSSTESRPDRGSADHSIQPVDWERLMLTAENDREFAGELVQLFIESGDSVLKEIRDALERGDLAAVGRAAHTLKGSSANMHATLTSEAAARLESAARAGAIDEVSQFETQLRSETQKAFAYLRSRRFGT